MHLTSSKEYPFYGIETRRDLTSLRSSSNLAQGVLGFFDLKQSVTVFPAAHRGHEAFLYTTYHEKSHERLIKVTSFGKFQNVLAMLTDETHVLPSHLQNVEEMLKQTMNVSWYAHEGYATYNEYSLASLSARNSMNLGRMSVLPDDYADALDLYRGIVDTLPKELIPFDRYFADAVAQVAFNTSILSALPFEGLDSALLSEHLTLNTNKPDGRIKLLNECFRGNGVRDEAWFALLGDIEQFLRDIGVPYDYDAQRYIDNLRTNPSLDALVMRRRLRGTIVDLFAREIFKLCPWARGMSPSQAHEQADRYHEDTRRAVEVYGANIPHLTKVANVTPADAQLLHLGVELPSYRKFSEYVVRDDEAPRILETLLKEEKDASFCVEVRALTGDSKTPENTPLQYQFRITSITWVPQDALTGKTSPVAAANRKLLPATPQLTFFGSSNKLKPIFEYISSQVLWVVLNPSSLNPKSLRSDRLLLDSSSLFGDWRGRFYSFFSSTDAYFVLKVLEMWRANGVTAIWYGGKNQFLTYNSVILEGGLREILIMPSNLLHVLNQEHKELFEWFVRCRESAMPDKDDKAWEDEYRQLRVVTFLNELGAFNETDSK